MEIKAPKKTKKKSACTTTKAVKGMTFAKAVEAIKKGSSVQRLSRVAEGIVVSMSEDGLKFLKPCGKGLTEYRACIADCLADDWVVVD